MPRLPFFLVDAFTTAPLTGNACAVVLDAEAIASEHHRMLAREMNRAETAFVRAIRTDSTGVSVDVRFFTPAEEIPLAGHPILAVAATLVHARRLPLAVAGEPTALRVDLRDGPIHVAVRHTDQIGVVHGRMIQRSPEFLAVYDPAEVLPVFGLRPRDLLPDVPIQTVSTGTPQLMVPLRNQDALRRARLDANAYRELRAQSDFFSPHLFCLGGMTSEGVTAARHFGVDPDLPEDPVTGSATGGMAAYLWRYGLLELPAFVAEQGHWIGRPGRVEVEVLGPPANMTGVAVGGTALVVGNGHLRY